MRSVIVLVAVSCAGCAHFPWDDASLVASAVVGPEGGRVEGEGIALAIPAGALGEATRITIYESTTEIDPRYALMSPVFRIEPHGLEFAETVHVQLEVPADSWGVVLRSNRDGTDFEFAGFVESGVATGETTHFSDFFASEEGSSCGAGDACDDGCDGDPDFPDPTALSESCTGIEEPCDRICGCYADDEPGQLLCASNPGDPRIACPEDNAAIGEILSNGSYLRPAEGHEMLGPRNGAECAAAGLRGLYGVTCDCYGWAEVSPGAFMETTLCPAGRWENRATTPGTYNWGCTSDYMGREPNVLRDGQVFLDAATRGYTGVNGQLCSGEYIGSDSQPRGMETAFGPATLRNCSPRAEVVGGEWRDVTGHTEACVPFRWPNAQEANNRSRARTPEMAALRAGCGEIPEAEWRELQMVRNTLGMPPRGHNEMPRGTAAMLRVEGQPPIYGANSRAYSNAGADRTTNLFCGPGRTITHAEGDVLNQLAQIRQSVPVATRGMCPSEPAYSESNIGNCPPESRGGSGHLYVDRNPCGGSCAPYGIDRMRRAACLDELFVTSPRGTTRFANGLDEAGMPFTP